MRTCLLENKDGEIVAISKNKLENIGQSAGRIVVEAHIPPIVFSMPILCVCFAWVVMLPRFTTKKMFCFLCFISTLKLEANHDNTICISNAGETQRQLINVGNETFTSKDVVQDKGNI